MGKSDLGGKHKYRGDTCSQWEESDVKSYGNFFFFLPIKAGGGGSRGEISRLAYEPCTVQGIRDLWQFSSIKEQTSLYISIQTASR